MFNLASGATRGTRISLLLCANDFFRKYFFSSLALCVVPSSAPRVAHVSLQRDFLLKTSRFDKIFFPTHLCDD